MAAASKSRAPWRDLLESHMNQTPGYEFSIATIGQDKYERPVPRVRTCGCRGFFPELKIHPKSQEEMNEQIKDGGNPPTYESDMLCFTTDIRMDKLAQLETSEHAIEAMFWLKDLMTQWRIKGKALAIGDPRGVESEQEKANRESLHSSLRIKDDYNGSAADWTWERAITKYFANHSPLARGELLFADLALLPFHVYPSPFSDLHLTSNLGQGSFKNPAPGMPRPQASKNPALRMGQRVTDLQDPVARGNFRVVVIQPEEVERLDLSNQEDMRRWNWSLDLDGDEENQADWIETEVWP